MSEENRTNAPEEELTQEDINSLKKIRMDKLEELHSMKSLRLSLRDRQARTRKSSRSFSRQTA